MATTTIHTRPDGQRERPRNAGSTPAYWTTVVVVPLIVLATVIGLLAMAGMLIPPHPADAAPRPGFAYQSARPVISSGVRSSSTPVISRIVTSATQTTHP